MIAVLAAALLLPLATSTPTPASAPTPGSPSGPTFCMEWIRQSNEGYDRLTLFRDRALVWKTSRHGKEEVKREMLDPAEAQYYCGFVERAEFWALPADFRTRLASEFASESLVTLARADGNRKTIRFDELSSHTADSSSLVAALDGLKGVFLSPLSPPSRYSPDVLPPGTLLKRFDGAVFRVLRLVRETGFVEIAGVNEPYSQWVKIDELRYQFAPPEHAP